MYLCDTVHQDTTFISRQIAIIVISNILVLFFCVSVLEFVKKSMLQHKKVIILVVIILSCIVAEREFICCCQQKKILVALEIFIEW